MVRSALAIREPTSLLDVTNLLGLLVGGRDLDASIFPAKLHFLAARPRPQSGSMDRGETLEA